MISQVTGVADAIVDQVRSDTNTIDRVIAEIINARFIFSLLFRFGQTLLLHFPNDDVLFPSIIEHIQHHPCQMRVEKYILCNYIILNGCATSETSSLEKFLSKLVKKLDGVLEVPH